MENEYYHANFFQESWLFIYVFDQSILDMGPSLT